MIEHQDRDMAGKTKEIVRYKENPFIDDLNLSVRSKQVRVSRLGKDQDVMVNEDTGEVRGTVVSTFKKVDDEQFVKLFTANIALTFDLTAAGIKAFNVVIWLIQNKAIERDIIAIDKFVLEDFNEVHNKKLSKAVLYRGLDNLIQCKIIARARREGDYFINPSFMFNGDRIVFATIIERKKAEDKE